MAVPAVAAKLAHAAAHRLIQRKARKVAVRQARKVAARASTKKGSSWQWWLLGLLVVTPAGLLALTALMLVVISGGGGAASSQASSGFGGLGPAPTAVDGIPSPVLDAYRHAPDYARRFTPACRGVRWSILAGIGHIESHHGAGRPLDPNGDLHTRPIIGVPLDGSNGTARIIDSDGGRFDGDRVYDRAVGPMQFIPSSWRTMGRDGNDDGVADPHNIYDAVAAAVVHLCGTGPKDLSDRATLDAAIYGYNASRSYVAQVLAQVDRYDQLTPTSAGGDSASGTTVETYPAIISLIADSAVPYGVTSTRRTPEAGGGVSYHHVGQAVDFALPPAGARDTPQLLAINQFFARYAPGLTELIYTGPGATCVKNGTVVPCTAAAWGASTVAEHHDHVHVAATPDTLRQIGLG